MSNEQQLVDAAWENMARTQLDADAAAKAAVIAKGPGGLKAATHKIHLAIVDALTVAGIGATAYPSKYQPNDTLTQWTFPKLEVSGISYLHLDVNEEHSSAHYRHAPTGKYRVIYGDYGNRTSFPQRKDGTHNYTRIAEMIKASVERAKAQNEVANARKGNKAGVDKLHTELDLPTYGGNMKIEPSSNFEKPVNVHVEIKRSMTYSETIALHAALKTLNLI